MGDPHVKKNNIDESDTLFEFVAKIALERKVDRIELVGDLFDTHEIVHLSVLDFWNNWLEHLSDICETVVLIGNHDYSGDYNSNFSALSLFWKRSPDLKIVEYPLVLGDIGYVSYIHDNNKFIEIVNGLAEKGVKHIVSHTTYEGSKYESGIFAPGGVTLDRIDPRIQTLHSGHIHSEQEFGKVWYCGTPRWLTTSDANLRKGIWLLTYDEGQSTYTEREFISTEGVCTSIVSIDVKEGDPIPDPDSRFGEGKRVLLNLIGSSDWITKTKHGLQGSGFRISSKITDTRKSKARKTGKNLYEYIWENYKKEEKEKEKLIAFMRELKLV